MTRCCQDQRNRNAKGYCRVCQRWMADLSKLTARERGALAQGDLAGRALFALPDYVDEWDDEPTVRLETREPMTEVVKGRLR